MSGRTYGQYCGLAHAMELVGERWALLIVRDLLPGPKRFTDLRRGLPKIPTNILSARLKELEATGIIHRRLLPPPDRSVVYDLTGYGRELDDILLRLGVWGARSLGQPRPGDILTTDSLLMALRATFHCERARDLGLDATFELRAGEVVLHARVHDGTLDIAPGPAAGGADLVIETGPALRALLAGELRPSEATASGAVHLSGTDGAPGDPALLERFVEVFHLPPPPAPAA